MLHNHSHEMNKKNNKNVKNVFEKVTKNRPEKIILTQKQKMNSALE